MKFEDKILIHAPCKMSILFLKAWKRITWLGILSIEPSNREKAVV
jgi:hypothetical protein